MKTCDNTARGAPTWRGFAGALAASLALIASLGTSVAQAAETEESVGRASVARILGAAALHPSAELNRYVSSCS